MTRKRKFEAIVEIAACVGILCALMTSARAGGHKVTLEILGQNEAHRVWLRSFVAPPLEFKILGGELPKEQHSVECKQSYDKRGENSYLVLSCDEGLKLELVGVSLAN
jgi:hypothetical protein